MAPVTSLPPAGWYDDPEHAGYLRYWDGAQWTDHRSPVGASTAATAGTGRLPDIGDWLGRTFRDLWARKLQLLVIGALALACFVIAGLLVSWSVNDLVYIEGSWEGFDGGRIALAGLGLVMIALALLVIYVAVVHQLFWSRFGEDPSAADSLSVALAKTPRVIGWGLVLVAAFIVALIVLGVLIALAPVLGVLAFLAMIPFAVWLWVKLSFFLVAILAPEAGRNPLQSSASVSEQGRFWGVFGRLLLLSVVGGAVGYVLSLPFGAAAGSGDFDDIIVTDGADEVVYLHVGDLVDEIGIGGGTILVLSSIPQLLTSAISVSGSTALYAEVKGRPQAVDQV